MNRKKIKRVKRLHSLESKKLNLTKTELQKVQNRLFENARQLAFLNQQLESEMNAPVSSETTIADLQHRNFRSELVERSIESTESHKLEIESHQNQLLHRIMQQKATLTGWEKLIQKMEQEDAHELANKEMNEQDDRYLHTITNEKRRGS